MNRLVKKKHRREVCTKSPGPSAPLCCEKESSHPQTCGVGKQLGGAHVRGQVPALVQNMYAVRSCQKDKGLGPASSNLRTRILQPVNAPCERHHHGLVACSRGLQQPAQSGYTVFSDVRRTLRAASGNELDAKNVVPESPCRQANPFFWTHRYFTSEVQAQVEIARASRTVVRGIQLALATGGKEGCSLL